MATTAPVLRIGNTTIEFPMELLRFRLGRWQRSWYGELDSDRDSEEALASMFEDFINRDCVVSTDGIPLGQHERPRLIMDTRVAKE